jgi:UDP-3-O-[3-hydroxymyristoyl] glucosamine N-acyltransferase
VPATNFRLADLARSLGGEVLGDPDTEVCALASLMSAGPGDLSFFNQARYRSQLDATRASAVIVSEAERDSTSLPRIVCSDPYAYYARAVALLHPEPVPAPGIHALAAVAPDAVIDPSASIGPGCHVGRGASVAARAVLEAGCSLGDGASLGEDSRLHANVTIYPRCVIGRRAIIHSGAVIGADGFGMAREGERWRKIPQIGRVVIGDDVEIGANTAIDRGALDDTVIEDGVKLDNLIQIGHNVRIGANTAMAGCVGVAGSARIGRRCTIGGGASILGHLEICDDVNIGALGIVSRSINEPGTYAGFYPLQKKKDWARTAVLLRNLERLHDRVEALERSLGEKPGPATED